MINNSLQGALQKAIRDALGCANSYEGDLHALANLYGVADGAISGRLIPVAQKHDSTIGTASGALNYLLLNPTQLPTLGLNMVDGTDVLDSRVTFTRASSGTRTNSAGTLVTMTTDEPRFDYDPSTLASKGLLIEEQRTNLTSYSDDATQWGAGSNMGTTQSNVEISPDGTLNADKLIENTANSTHFLSQSQTTSYTSGTAYTRSAFVKYGGRQYFALYLPALAFPDAGRTAVFDLQAGTVATSEAGVTASIVAGSNGWYRCIITATADATVSSHVGGFQVSDNASLNAYVGDGVSGVFVYGAQLEAGAFATSYIPTATAAATRAADSAVISTLTPWYNQSAGTFYVKAIGVANTQSATRRFIEIGDGTINERMILGYSATISSRLLVVDGGATQADITANATAGSVVKMAASFAANDFRQATNGVSGVADTSGGVPTVTTVYIGRDFAGADTTTLNGWLQTFAFYQAALPNATLQALTA